jgi:hypothetical protein
MANVLVLAEDGCIGFSCAEILRHSGFQASVGAWPAGAGGSVKPDIILAWDPSESVARLIRAAHQGVPLLVCAWAHQQRCPPGTGIILLPFNAERVANTLSRALRHADASAPRPRAA